MTNYSKMSYIYHALKPHLCKDVIGIIEDMVRWEWHDEYTFHYPGYPPTIYPNNDPIKIINDSYLHIFYDTYFKGEKTITNADLKNKEFVLLPFEYCLKSWKSSYGFYRIIKINSNAYAQQSLHNNYNEKLKIPNNILFIANTLQELPYSCYTESSMFYKLKDL